MENYIDIYTCEYVTSHITGDCSLKISGYIHFDGIEIDHSENYIGYDLEEARAAFKSELRRKKKEYVKGSE